MFVLEFVGWNMWTSWMWEKFPSHGVISRGLEKICAFV